MKSNSNAPIHTRESLQLEQYRLKRVIKEQEQQLRQRVQQLPGELVYAGVDAVLPGALTGSITEKILRYASNFINKSIIKKNSGHTSRLVALAKQAGIFTLLKLAYNIFIKKK
jgi:hypothetical protein